MGYLVSIEDVTPPARSDGAPWTEAVISEGKDIDGEWAVISTTAISPLDSDPEHPLSRSFSTSEATLTEGWYLLTFKDASGNEYPMNALPLFPKVFAPTIADVAVLVRARTVDDSGNQLGTFTADTRPTAVEVHELIAKAVAAVSAIAVVTIDSPPQAIMQARQLAALYAAVLLEISYFPEQTNTEQSAYDNLYVLYIQGVQKLEASLPDTASLKKGMYSIQTRSDYAGLLSTAEQIP